MSKVNKGHLVELVSERAGVSKATTSEVLRCVFAVIAEELAKGSSVTVPGFGTWRIKVCRPRAGRDVRTGRKTMIPARTRVAFKAGAGLHRAAECSIDPEIFFGDGVPRAAELDAVFAELFGLDRPGLEEIRKKMRTFVDEGLTREALEFIEALTDRSPADEPAK